jgi:hypothetical protein
LEEHCVFFVRKRVSTFDHIDTYLCEPLSDIEFVLQGQAHSFALGTVTERCVVDEDRSFLHDFLLVVKTKNP